MAGYVSERKALHSPVRYKLKESYPNIYIALPVTILATVPVSAATAERSFSLLKRLKT